MVNVQENIGLLVEAIRSAKRVRLIYRRKYDEVTSVHEIAPVDIRRGPRETTGDTPYLWAWCFAEDKLETHFLDRIERVIVLDEIFDPAQILGRWPEQWPRPDEWVVPREWDESG